MTIQSETSKVVYIGDGKTRLFPVPFYFFDNQINVYNNFSNTPLRLNIDYLLTKPENQAGGMVSIFTAPAEGTVITITRNVELKQLITFLEGEDFPATDFEHALDKLTMGLQQLHECVERAVLVPNGASITGNDLFHCLELLHQYWDRVMAIPDYVDQLMNSTTDTVNKGDTRLITSVGVQQYTYSKNMVDAKMDAMALKFYHVNIDITPDTVEENHESEDYPYKFNIALNGAEENHCPVVMFSKEDALSNTFAPYSNAYNGGISIYLKEDIRLSTTIP